MSDIDIQLPWSFDVLFILSLAFWPLTVVATGAAIWLCVARASRAARIVAAVVAIAWCLSAGMHVYAWVDGVRSNAASAAYDRSHRRTLASDSIESGMHLPAGTVVVTDEDFHLSWLELSKPTVLFGVPLTGTVGLRGAKLDGSQSLQHDATIDGLPCAADGGVLFDDGRLSNCRLTRPTTIGGVPCRGYVSIGPSFLGCELSQPYRRYGTTWYEGTDVRGNEDNLTFTIGKRAPSLRAYGSVLPQGTMVVYASGIIVTVSLNAPIHYRGCALRSIDRRDGARAEVEGPCSLPALPHGRVSVPNLM